MRSDVFFVIINFNIEIWPRKILIGEFLEEKSFDCEEKIDNLLKRLTRKPKFE